jgi:hypothetical protein
MPVPLVAKNWKNGDITGYSKGSGCNVQPGHDKSNVARRLFDLAPRSGRPDR